MKTEKKYKTPEYTRRAIDKYNSKFARFTISTPREVKDRLNAVLKPSESANALINDLLLQEIERREADLQQAAQEAPQDTAPGARTNRHEATKSATEGRTEAQEGKTSAGTAEGSPQEKPKPRGRWRKASGANKSPQETTGGSEAATPAGETTGGPEEGTTAGSPENITAGSPQDAQPVEAAENGTKGTDAPQHLTPGTEHLQYYWSSYAADDIPPEELPFH